MGVKVNLYSKYYKNEELVCIDSDCHGYCNKYL